MVMVDVRHQHSIAAQRSCTSRSAVYFTMGKSSCEHPYSSPGLHTFFALIPTAIQLVELCTLCCGNRASWTNHAGQIVVGSRRVASEPTAAWVTSHWCLGQQFTI